MNKSNAYISPVLACDCYKLSHKNQYPIGTQKIYSTLTPRTNQYAPHIEKVVSFGFQAFVKKYLIQYFNENFFQKSLEEVLEEYESMNYSLFGVSVDSSHIKALHELGYLPLLVKVIPEGKTVDLKIPVFTIENTHPDFYWLTNYFETLISCSTWQPMASASIARVYYDTCDYFANLTCDDKSHLPFQCHDFSMRGMSSLESSQLSGAGHLLYFKGTDTILAISYLKENYPTQSNELIGTSIPATEHSVMSSHGMDELETFRYLIEDVYPSGFVSIVSDTYDFWKNVTETIPALKEKILARNGKVVIRPDSGNPTEILCGLPTLSFDSLEEMKKHCCSEHETGIFRVGNDYVKVKFINTPPRAYEYVKDFDDEFKIVDLTQEELAIHKGLVECLWDIFGGSVNSKGYKKFLILILVLFMVIQLQLKELKIFSVDYLRKDLLPQM